MTGRLVGYLAVAVAAVSVAGLSGYLAGRTSTPAVTQIQPVAVDTSAAETPGSAVSETEEPVPAADPAEPTSTAAPTVRTPAASAQRDEPVEAPRATVPPVKAPAVKAPVVRPPAVATPAPAVRGSAPVSPAPRQAEAAPSVAARHETPRPVVAGEPVARPSAPEPVVEAAPEGRTAVVEPAAAPTPTVEEFVVPSDSVIGLRLDDTISSETARVEQRVQARVSREVRVNGTVVVPSNSRAEGQVTLVEAGGKFRERARLGVRFHTLVLADGTSVPIQTDVIYRDGEAVGTRSAARIGGSAIGGAIIGAIFGGGKGAAIGAAAGAGAGTAATAATQKSRAVLSAGSTVTVRLTSPTTVSVERDDN